MPLQFATKKEAIEKAELLKSRKNGNSFCPLIPGTCRTDCECFIRAWVKVMHETWCVYGHQCNNAMFTGERYNHDG